MLFPGLRKLNYAKQCSEKEQSFGVIEVGECSLVQQGDNYKESVLSGGHTIASLFKRGILGTFQGRFGNRICNASG
jgi:hypothetical protein